MKRVFVCVSLVSRLPTWNMNKYTVYACTTGLVLERESLGTRLTQMKNTFHTTGDTVSYTVLHLCTCIASDESCGV